MIHAVEQLLLLVGLSLGQAVSVADEGVAIEPLSFIQVHGQRHLVQFPELASPEAVDSLQAMLAMHGREIDVFSLVTPTGFGRHGTASEIIGYDKARGHNTRLIIELDADARFGAMTIEIDGKRLTGDGLQRALDVIDSGYRQHAREAVVEDDGEDKPLPALPSTDLSA
ncbi:MAG: hypothetical protein AAF515_16305 [Pseudomonadota bacterium]